MSGSQGAANDKLARSAIKRLGREPLEPGSSYKSAINLADEVQQEPMTRTELHDLSQNLGFNKSRTFTSPLPPISKGDARAPVMLAPYRPTSRANNNSLDNAPTTVGKENVPPPHYCYLNIYQCQGDYELYKGHQHRDDRGRERDDRSKASSVQEESRFVRGIPLQPTRRHN